MVVEDAAEVGAGRSEAAVGTGEVVAEGTAGVGVGRSEAAVGTGEVVAEETAGVGAGRSEAAVGTGEVVAEETAGVGAGGSEAAVGTGEVVAEVGTGGTEATVGAGEVVAEGMARPGRDGAVEGAFTLRGTILGSAGAAVGLLVVIVALLKEGKLWIGSCMMAFRMFSSAGCSAFKRLSSARVRSWGWKSGERLRRERLGGGPWTLTYCAGWRRALTRSARNWSSPVGWAGLPLWMIVAVSAYKATTFVTYKSSLSTRATITLMVMGAFKMPIMRMHKSTMQRKNSRRKRLQQPLLVGAGPSLSKPLLVETITAQWRLLMSLANLVLRRAQGSRADSSLGGDLGGDPCWTSPSPLGVILTCLFWLALF